MQFHFDIRKTLAAVGYVLKLNKGKLSHLNLMKILYASDRKMLIDWGKPITGDFMCSMPHGPALKRIVEMAAGDAPSQLLWDEFFSDKGGGGKRYLISMKKEPDFGFLSPAETAVLKQFNSQFAKVPYHALMREVHGKNFPEWQHPRPCGSKPIDVESILRRASKTPSEIEDIRQKNKRRFSIHETLKRG